MGGSSSSKKQTTNTTNVTTETTTNIRDIGLTGAHATDLARILDAGTTSRQGLALDTVETISQQSGNAFQTLVGGAGALVESSIKAAKGITEGARERAATITEGARADAGMARQDAQSLFLKAGESQQESVQLIKTLLPVLLIPAVIALIPIFTRGRK